MNTPRFKLYYWPLPFRGCFVSYAFAYQNHPLELATTEELLEMMGLPASEQRVPFIGPPVLHDRETDRWLSQMPAIVLYVSEFLNLKPKDSFQAASAMKVLMDCNDVLMEICRYNGSSMWDQQSWDLFRGERLPKWLRIFEESLHNKAIGGDTVRFGDIATFALFSNMTFALPALEADLKEHAPGIYELCKKIGNQPSLKAFTNEEREKYGTLYCGGQIEKSLRKVLG